MHGPGYFEERQQPDKQLYVAGNTTVTLDRRVVHVTVPNNSTFTITLPNVTEAEGYTFLIHGLSIGNSTSHLVVNYTKGTASGKTTSLDTTGVQLLFESNGVEWFVERSNS